MPSPSWSPDATPWPGSAVRRRKSLVWWDSNHPGEGGYSPPTAAVWVARWIGDAHRMQLHDFWTTRTYCRLRDITPHQRRDFDTLRAAHHEGFRPCPWCIGDIPLETLEKFDVAAILAR